MSDTADAEMVDTWSGSSRRAKRVAIALVVEPIGLLASIVYFVAPDLLDATILGRVVGVLPLLAAGVAGIVVLLAGARFMKHSRGHEGKTYGPQAAQYSIRFGQAGNEVFARAGFTRAARNVQRVLTGVVPIGLLAYIIATG